MNLQTDARHLIRIAIIALCSLALAGCIFPAWDYRFRLTLVISTPESRIAGVPIEASGVWRFYYRDTWNWLRGLQTRVISTHGEAIEINLGERGKFFVLLSGGKYMQPAAMTWMIYNKPGEFSDQMEALGRLNVPLYVEDFSLLPLLVRFRDLSDPTTVERVDPNDLEKSFGRGVRLLNARLERTTDPTTQGLGTTLPWLDTGPPGKPLVRTTEKFVKDIPLEHLLTYLDFRSLVQ